MKSIAQKVTEAFNPKDSNKLKFLMILNDKDFLNQITMQGQTQLSYSVYGQKNRLKGKASLTNPVNQALTNRKNKIQKYEQIADFLYQDFGKVIPNANEVFSKDVVNEIAGNVYDLIDEVITAHFKNEKVSGRDLIFVATTKKTRSKKLTSTTGETMIKSFYKDLYRNFENRFVKNMEQITKLRQKKYLGGALELSEKISETPFGATVLATIYPKTNDNQLGEIDKGLTLNQIVDVFLTFLRNQITIFTSSSIGAGLSGGLTYFNQNYNKIKNILINSYQKKGNETDSIRQFAQFSKSNVSGLLGEIASVISFTADSGMTALIIGSDKNSLGQKVAVDVKLTVYHKKGRRKDIGIQVKNYTAKQKNIPLYNDTSIDLSNNMLKRYIPKNDLKVFQFLAANYNLESNAHYTRELLEEFLLNYSANFLRTKDLTDTTGLTNNFYYINNQVYPTSYILSHFLIQALDIMLDAKKRATFFTLEGLFPSVKNIPPEAQGSNYMPMEDQPRAEKIDSGSRGRYMETSAYQFDYGGETFPRKIANSNLLSDLRINFKGINVKIN